MTANRARVRKKQRALYAVAHSDPFSTAPSDARMKLVSSIGVRAAAPLPPDAASGRRWAGKDASIRRISSSEGGFREDVQLPCATQHRRVRSAESGSRYHVHQVRASLGQAEMGRERRAGRTEGPSSALSPFSSFMCAGWYRP